VNRINATLAQLKENGRKALVTYIVCGDPKPSMTVSAMHTLVESGADIIELGVPFSDPMAEGPVIQKGHERALEHNVSLTNCMETVAEFRTKDAKTPVVLMGYANPVERMGYANFAERAKSAGVDALLTVDLPPEEGKDLDAHLRNAGLENIFLVAPTTSAARTKAICEIARGFVYYVSVKGVTGAGHLDVESVEQHVTGIKKVSTSPVLVGFGIKDAASAKAVASVSDGVVVGSALVKIMANEEQNAGDIAKELSSLVSSMRAGLDELSE